MAIFKHKQCFALDAIFDYSPEIVVNFENNLSVLFASEGLN
jgi:hypothetical protein